MYLKYVVILLLTLFTTILTGAANADTPTTAATTIPSLNLNLSPEWQADKVPQQVGSNHIITFYYKNKTTPQAEELDVAQIRMTSASIYDDTVKLLYNPQRITYQAKNCQLVDIGQAPQLAGPSLQKFGYFLQCQSANMSGFELYMIANPTTLYYMSYRVHGFPASPPQQDEMMKVLSNIQVCQNGTNCISAIS
jgi:hypothetical protein